MLGDDQEHEQRHEGPVDEEGQEGQLEHVEADRLVELRVTSFRRLAAAEQQPVLPLAARRRARRCRAKMNDTTVRKAKVCRPTICWYRRTISSSGETSSARGAMRSTTQRLTQQATKKAPTNVRRARAWSRS